MNYAGFDNIEIATIVSNVVTIHLEQWSATFSGLGQLCYSSRIHEPYTRVLSFVELMTRSQGELFLYYVAVLKIT